MRFRSFQSILDECVNAVLYGETVESCLTRYPRHAQRLKPLLTLAERVRRTPAAQPRPWAQATAWNAVRARAAELRAGKRRAASIQVSFGWLKPVALVFAFVLALGAAGGAGAVASQDALPNDTLYPVKLFTEDARVWLTFDDTSRADLLLDQSDERMKEIAALISHGEPIPSSVLSALRDRNHDAIKIINDHPEETELLDRSRRQAESQERILVALWEQIDGAARNEYTQAVAQVHNSRLGGADGTLAVLQPEDLQGGIGTITGTVDAVEDGIWTVGGYQIRVDTRTIGSLGIEPGSTASFTVGHSTSGRRYALLASLIQTGAPPTQAVVYGEVEEVTDEGVLIAGQLIPMTRETVRTLQIRRGEAIQVSVRWTDTGIVATEVHGGTYAAGADSRALIFEGNLESTGDGDSRVWTIGGLTFEDSPRTQLDLAGGPAVPGARVLVEARWLGDRLSAQTITVLKSEAEEGQVYLLGTFDGTGSGGLWVVSGVKLAGVGSQQPKPGSLVAVEASEEDGALTIRRVTAVKGPEGGPLSQFKGTALLIEGSTWNMEIGKVRVNSTTEVSGKPIQGARAIVWYAPGDGILQATYVHVLDEEPVVQPPEEQPAESE